MVKDKEFKRNLSIPVLFSKTSKLKGYIFLVLSCLTSLSLLSFNTFQRCTQNWIGIVGWSSSTFLVYCFGATAFVIPFYFLYSAFLNFKKVSPLEYRLKSIAFLTILISVSLLLSMISPINTLPQSLNSKLPLFELGLSPSVCYLGGIPFHFIYQGSSVCLKHLIGRVGTALFASVNIVFCSLYLTNSFSLLKKKLKLQNIIHIIKKVQSFLFNKLILSLFDLKKYLPKPSFKVKESNECMLNTNNEVPTEIIENFDYRPDQNIETNFDYNETIKYEQPSNLFIAPHPQNRVIPLSKISVQNTKIPNDSSKITPLPKSQPTNKLPIKPILKTHQQTLPKYSLLTKNEFVKPESIQQELEKKAIILQSTLAGFGIEVSVGNICAGPTLAAFEVMPPTGVKVQKIKALENDIALNLKASSIRIIAPIPGKAAVGIEIPAPSKQEVSFRDLLESYQKQNNKLQIPLLLGKKANGENLWSDLATMPHLIIAGTTGSGKSVCINAIVMSIIMNKTPEEVKLVIVDPKKVELTGYSNLPHMLSPVITESQDAHNALQWLVKEMESRYEILRFLGLRNIQSFNNRIKNMDVESSYDKEIPDQMPFMVGIIDELADLLLSSSHDIETPIIRLAQMARAVGIHIILATQRPSREVITGLIKANFPARISFKVANRVNSQIVIDESGAEILMGNGDMLFLSPSSFGTIRAQGAYICDDDINKVIHDLCSRFPTNYVVPSFSASSFITDIHIEDADPLYSQAQKLILDTRNASTTFLQRKLKIGYARAASLMDQLESAGIIGPAEGAKPRKILTQRPNILDD